MKPHRTLPALALGVVLLAGCSSETPAEWNAREEVTETTSALETTLRDTGSATLPETCSGLSEASGSVADLPDAPEDSTTAVSDLATSLDAAVTACEAAVASGDPEALTTAATSIVAVKEAFAETTGREAAAS